MGETLLIAALLVESNSTLLIALMRRETNSSFSDTSANGRPEARHESVIWNVVGRGRCRVIPAGARIRAKTLVSFHGTAGSVIRETRQDGLVNIHGSALEIRADARLLVTVHQCANNDTTKE